MFQNRWKLRFSRLFGESKYPPVNRLVVGPSLSLCRIRGVFVWGELDVGGDDGLDGEAYDVGGADLDALTLEVAVLEVAAVD